MATENTMETFSPLEPADSANFLVPTLTDDSTYAGNSELDRLRARADQQDLTIAALVSQERQQAALIVHLQQQLQLIQNVVVGELDISLNAAVDTDLLTAPPEPDISWPASSQQHVPDRHDVEDQNLSDMTGPEEMRNARTEDTGSKQCKISSGTRDSGYGS